MIRVLYKVTLHSFSLVEEKFTNCLLINVEHVFAVLLALLETPLWALDLVGYDGVAA